jgi:hypothetical protein
MHTDDLSSKASHPGIRQPKMQSISLAGTAGKQAASDVYGKVWVTQVAPIAMDR